jgi:hypothetical protein
MRLAEIKDNKNRAKAREERIKAKKAEKEA